VGAELFLICKYHIIIIIIFDGLEVSLCEHLFPGKFHVGVLNSFIICKYHILIDGVEASRRVYIFSVKYSTQCHYL
jgi:hypothetical protein